jgi:hypothetical protein
VTFTATVDAGLSLVGATAAMSIVKQADFDSATRDESVELSWQTLGTVVLSLDGTTLTAALTMTAAQMGALVASPPNDRYTYAYHLRAETSTGLTIAEWAGSIEVRDAPD